VHRLNKVAEVIGSQQNQEDSRRKRLNSTLTEENIEQQ